MPPELASDERAVELLQNARSIIVVGLSPKEHRDSNRVTAHMIAAGYDVVGVRPGHDEILGVPCFESLGALPADVRSSVDLVIVFRRPDAVPAILAEIAAMNADHAQATDHSPVAAWLQLGVSSSEAIETAAELNIELVVEKCAMVVHRLHVH